MVRVTDPAYGRFEVVDDVSDLSFAVVTVLTSIGRVRAAVCSGGGRVATIFLHGVGLTLESWTPVIQAARSAGLSTDDWVLLDVPGFGDSDALESGTTIEQVGEAVMSAAHQLGYSSFILVGHSMGGFLALDMASRAPRGLLSVLSISGAYGGIVQAVNHPLVSLRERPVTWLVYQALRAATATSVLTRLLPRHLIPSDVIALALSPVAAHPRSLPVTFLRSIAEGMRSDSFRVAARTGVGYDVVHRWAQITVPVTATFGRQDALVTAADLQALASAASSTYVVPLEDVGHFAPVERPDLVAELVADLRAAEPGDEGD